MAIQDTEREFWGIVPIKQGYQGQKYVFCYVFVTYGWTDRTGAVTSTRLRIWSLDGITKCLHPL